MLHRCRSRAGRGDRIIGRLVTLRVRRAGDAGMTVARPSLGTPVRVLWRMAADGGKQGVQFITRKVARERVSLQGKGSHRCPDRNA